MEKIVITYLDFKNDGVEIEKDYSPIVIPRVGEYVVFNSMLTYFVIDVVYYPLQNNIKNVYIFVKLSNNFAND